MFPDDSVDQSIVDVAKNGDGWVYLGEFFNGNDGRGEGASCASLFRAGFNAHKLGKVI